MSIVFIEPFSGRCLLCRKIHILNNFISKDKKRIYASVFICQYDRSKSDSTVCKYLMILCALFVSSEICSSRYFQRVVISPCRPAILKVEYICSISK